jgi:hypothetical protein
MGWKSDRMARRYAGVSRQRTAAAHARAEPGLRHSCGPKEAVVWRASTVVVWRDCEPDSVSQTTTFQGQIPVPNNNFGAGNGIRTRGLNFGKYTAAVYGRPSASTPSRFERELSRSVRRCPCLTVVKTVVKTTFYHEKS